MSEQWHVELTFQDSKSSKFWRGRVQGNDVEINYGRIGSDGQRQVKRFDSPTHAQAELDKQASSKRKKGYVDSGMASPATAETPPASAAQQAPAASTSVRYLLTMGERRLQLQLRRDGTTITTEATEQYGDEGAAQVAFDQLCQAMEAEGYQKQ